VLFTVLLSVFAHGLSAFPLASIMARYRHSQRRAGKADPWDPADTHIRPRRHRIPEQHQAGLVPQSARPAEQAHLLDTRESYGSTPL
jgi:hypothetical protein